jgi:hypothetical protein
MSHERSDAGPDRVAPRRDTERDTAPGFKSGASLSAADLRTLQGRAGNRVVGRLVAARREAPAAPVLPPRPPARTAVAAPIGYLLRQDPDGLYSIAEEHRELDRHREFKDPRTGKWTPVFTDEDGYVLNPTARYLDEVIDRSSGRIRGDSGFENGTFSFAVHPENGRMVIGQRMGSPNYQWRVLMADARGDEKAARLAARRAAGMPHPTLIGGHNPRVPAAGDLETRACQVTKLNTFTGHYKVERPSLRPAVNAVLDAIESLKREGVPAHNAIAYDFRAESVHFDSDGDALPRKRFRTLRMLKLKPLREFTAVLRNLRPYRVIGRLRGGALRAGARTAGTAFADALTQLALQYVIDKLLEPVYNNFIEEQTAKLAEVVYTKFAEETTQAELDKLLEQDSDKPIFFNVTYRFNRVTLTTYEPGLIGSQVRMDATGPPIVTVDKVGYSHDAWSDIPVEGTDDPICGARVDYTKVTVSEAVTPDEIFQDEPPIPSQDTWQPPPR